MDYFKWKELDKIDETKPFTPKQVKDELKLETDNFTLDRGVFKYGFEEEARIAVKYLEQKGYYAEMNITDNPLFTPEHESYNVWFSKEELPDGYESGEWLKEESLEEGRKKKSICKGMGMWQWSNPEKGVEMFNHALGADNISTGASEGTSECLHEEMLYKLMHKVINPKTGEEIKGETQIMTGSKEECEKEKAHLEEVSPEDPAGNLNSYYILVVGENSFGEQLTEGRYSDLERKLVEKEKELKELKVKLENAYDEESREEIEISIDICENDIANIQGELAEIRYIDNGSSYDYDGYESLKEDNKEILLPHLDALFETEGFNAPYEWEFEGEKEIEESPFHFTYRVEGDSLKIYDQHEEFSIDYGEEFGYRPRDKKLDKIEQALKEDGFEDEVLEWENNVIMSIHIPESKMKKESLTESKLSWEDAIKDSYHSLVSSSGQVPTASQVLEDVADHYDLDIDVKIELDDPIKYNKWLSDVEHVLNNLGLEVLEEKLEESMKPYADDFEEFFWGVYDNEYDLPFKDTIDYINDKYGSKVWVETEDNPNPNGKPLNLSEKEQIDIFKHAMEEAKYWDNLDIYNSHARYKSISEINDQLKRIFGIQNKKLHEEKLVESETKYPEFLGFINGTLEELNPEEFIEKVKTRRQSLHTNRIAESSEDSYVVYTITCDLLGFDLDTCDVYVDVIKEEWDRKHGVDMDDPESYKFEEIQERVLMEDCGEGPDKWDKAIEVIKNFKDEHTNKNESLIESEHSDKKKLKYLLSKEKCCPLDKQERYELQDLLNKYGYPESLEENIDLTENSSYNIIEEESIMEEKKELNEAHRDDPEVKELLSEINDDIERLDELGINTNNLKEDLSRGEQIAKMVATLFKGQVGPFGGEDPTLKGNVLILDSQATPGDTYTFNDDGSIDVEVYYSGLDEDDDGMSYYHYDCFRDLLDSGDGWFYDLSKREASIVEDEIKELFEESLEKSIDSLD